MARATAVTRLSKLDASQKPKQIDLTHTSGEYKGKVLLGIYEFDGDTYRACVAPPGKDRPTEFSTKEGDGLLLSINKKLKK